MAAHLRRDDGDEKNEEEEHGSTGSDDNDSELDEDLEALKRACESTGTDLQPLFSAVRTLPPDSESENSDMDDYELARSVCEKFSVSADFEKTYMYMKPLSVVPPEDSDDGEDDLATLRAVQNRFSAYDQKAERSNMENSVKNVEQVRASSTPLEKENSDNLFVHRTNACKGFPDSEHPYHSTQNLESSSPNLAYQDSGYLEGHQLDIHVPRLSLVEGSGFPRAAQLLLDAIKKNRLCQKLIHNRLVQIEARIEGNKKLKDRAKILKDFQVSSKKRVGLVLAQKKDPRVQLISAPKRCEMKISAMRFGPEDNRDVASYRDAIAKFPITWQRQRWLNEEKDNLRKGIKQEFQKALLKKSVDLISYSEGSFGTSSDIDNVMASIKGLEITPENIRAYLPKVNWDEFASVSTKGRSGAECEARWLNWEDPLKNNTKWTRNEDKELLLTVKEKEMSNWIDIAVSLGTNRTPFQCLSRFQRSLNAQMVKREWEEEEDARLCAAVRAFGECNWQMVASVLDRRTGTQCSNRWKKSLNPARLRVGRWTIDEDKRLKVSVKLFGAKCWSKIAQFVPGRTQVQCRERWVNCLDPSLKRGPWTEDEDMKLMTAIREYNYCWYKVAACVPPRTDNQCRRRWMALCPDDVLKLQASKKIQQVAIISNFVDREEERPDLGPEDFMPPPMLCAAPESNTGEPMKKKKKKPREKTASQTGHSGHNMTSSDPRKRKRSRGRTKESQINHEATCDIVDGNEVATCINDFAATIESSTIEWPESVECNEQGRDDLSSNIDLGPTNTDIGGKLVTHNSSNRRKYKPRRKACAETPPIRRMPSVPASDSVPLQTNNSVRHESPEEGGRPVTRSCSNRKSYQPRRKLCAESAEPTLVPCVTSASSAQSVPLQRNNPDLLEIPVEGGKSGTHNYSKRKNYKPRRKLRVEIAPVQGIPSVPAAKSVPLRKNQSACQQTPVEVDKTASAEKKRSSTQRSSQKKHDQSISKKKNSELEMEMETVESTQLQLPMSQTSPNISGANEANRGSSEMDNINDHEPAEYSECLERIVYAQGATIGKIRKRKIASQTESKNYHEVIGGEVLNDKSSCEQVSEDTGKGDGPAAFIKKKRKLSQTRTSNRHKADMEIVERISIKQAITDLIQDDAPLASFIKKVKEKKKSKQSM